jgi:hypothetical protein
LSFQNKKFRILVFLRQNFIYMISLAKCGRLTIWVCVQNIICKKCFDMMKGKQKQLQQTTTILTTVFLNKTFANQSKCVKNNLKSRTAAFTSWFLCYHFYLGRSLLWGFSQIIFLAIVLSQIFSFFYLKVFSCLVYLNNGCFTSEKCSWGRK